MAAARSAVAKFPGHGVRLHVAAAGRTIPGLRGLESEPVRFGVSGRGDLVFLMVWR